MELKPWNRLLKFRIMPGSGADRRTASRSGAPGTKHRPGRDENPTRARAEAMWARTTLAGANVPGPGIPTGVRGARRALGSLAPGGRVPDGEIWRAGEVGGGGGAPSLRLPRPAEVAVGEVVGVLVELLGPLHLGRDRVVDRILHHDLHAAAPPPPPPPPPPPD